MNNTVFLHSINLHSDWVCNNVAIPSPINSVLALNMFGFQQPIGTPLYNCNVNDLYDHPDRCFGGFASPSFHTVQLASILRRGQKPVNGMGQIMEFTDEQKRRKIAKADLEIDFERERQARYPTKPSRLSSLFMVEDTDEGRGTLYNVFTEATRDGYYRPHVLNVKPILCMRQHKGDIRWLDQYLDTRDNHCITQYWEGNQVNNQEMSEIVIEGTLLPIHREQIEFVRENGTFFPNYDYRNYWQDLNAPQYAEWFRQGG